MHRRLLLEPSISESPRSGELRVPTAGGVFQAILRYAAACKDTLQSVTLENVTALLAPPRRKKGMGHSNATACIRGLEKIGLCTHLFQLDPSTMFGVPVSRPRVFFLAVPKKKIKGVMSNSEYHLMLTDIMQRLVGHPMVDLDEFLLQENSVPIQEYYAMLQADLELQRGNVDQAMIAQWGLPRHLPSRPRWRDGVRRPLRSPLRWTCAG